MKYFEICIKEIKRMPFVRESVADSMLNMVVGASMSERLEKSRMEGRHGWWDENVCSIEALYNLRTKALEDNDHVSVINFTAMIAAREAGVK